MKFRKKPIVIEARQWAGSSCDATSLHTWSDGKIKFDVNTRAMTIETLEGTHRASPGDWIIMGIKGEFYPCKPDIFQATYEKV